FRVQRRRRFVKEKNLRIHRKGASERHTLLLAYPCERSGGQQQRVSIARALAMNPKILFFDEPPSALDPELTGEVLKIIQKLAEDKMTMVIVTHEMAFARDVADKVIFMDGGVIVEQGSPDYVFNQSGNERLSSFLSRFTKA
ncbi:MAG: ATP-binding cassette domain-containing protein, partial [Fibrobacter sp.]|nr:ATP-binding cassette domain-containing protein [Fibrobacter sp.]